MPMSLKNVTRKLCHTIRTRTPSMPARQPAHTSPRRAVCSAHDSGMLYAAVARRGRRPPPAAAKGVRGAVDVGRRGAVGGLRVLLPRGRPRGRGGRRGARLERERCEQACKAWRPWSLSALSCSLRLCSGQPRVRVTADTTCSALLSDMRHSDTSSVLSDRARRAQRANGTSTPQSRSAQSTACRCRGR